MDRRRVLWGGATSTVLQKGACIQWYCCMAMATIAVWEQHPRITRRSFVRSATSVIGLQEFVWVANGSITSFRDRRGQSIVALAKIPFHSIHSEQKIFRYLVIPMMMGAIIEVMGRWQWKWRRQLNVNRRQQIQAIKLQKRVIKMTMARKSSEDGSCVNHKIAFSPMSQHYYFKMRVTEIRTANKFKN